ncbi:hypothetical protein EW146_g1020 [Bondarzewia mesenterica]|uniref:Uncharacterized protein n=1 Tax=Bondarzewia mesenterica TaxID=1095465 RepID=A0A4S4M539_9AGAM|nr:hypothetical protein EW146_g1020 [Bondarzewia mesenterica]
MASFSWSDSIRALVTPCLSCLQAAYPHPHLNNSHDPYTPDRLRTRDNDLEGLLADSGSSADADAETLSLHSNIGLGETRRKRRGIGKSIRFFGWDLFGKPPIHLPDDDEEQEAQLRRHRRQRRPTTLSSSTLDSDASPLDPSAIESRLHQQAAEEEARRTERAERRARRQERRELKRAAMALTMGDGEGEEFDGFQGSGSAPAHGRIPSPLIRGLNTQHGDYDAQEDEDAADFDAGNYTRRAPGSSSGNGSDSRSRTSTASLSQGQSELGRHYNHHNLSQPPPAAPSPPVPRSKKSSKSSKSSSSKKSTGSSTSTPQSPSIASPIASHFPMPTVGVVSPPSARGSAVVEEEEFEGFPRDMGFSSPRLPSVASGFPSPGLGGPRAHAKRDVGAFLANRGGA